MDYLIYIVALVGAFLILISVHELGHFVVARAAGVVVLRFSIGLGPALFKWISPKHGTEFVIAALPLGGYISMLDTRAVEDVDEELKPFAFDRIAPWKQIAVASAGPLANLLLAFVVYMLVMLDGKQVVVPYLGQIEPATPAYAAGLRGGEKLVAIDGIAVESQSDISELLFRRVGETGQISIGVEDEFAPHAHQIQIIDWLQDEKDFDLLASLGLNLGLPPIIDEVLTDSPAESARLRRGDHILAVDGSLIWAWGAFVDTVRASPEKTINLTVERDGIARQVLLTPRSIVLEDNSTIGQAGLRPLIETIQVGGGLISSVGLAAVETWMIVRLTVFSIKKMIVGELDASNLAGPITIGHLAGTVAQRGLEYYLRLIALLSVSLFLINLLPLPILDGGHIVYAMVEWISGKRVSETVHRYATFAGFVLIGGFFLFVLYNDILRVAS